jgi:hypothetical protein
MDFAGVPVLRVNRRLNERLPYPDRAFVPTFSIDLDDATTARLSEAIEVAVTKVQYSIRKVHMVRLAFGEPPAYIMPVGTGLEIYVADMTQDPIATASGDIIHIDARRLAALPVEPYDTAALFLAEELVHAWMNISNERIAKFVTATLFGEGVLSDGVRYGLAEDFGMAPDR